MKSEKNKVLSVSVKDAAEKNRDRYGDINKYIGKNSAPIYPCKAVPKKIRSLLHKYITMSEKNYILFTCADTCRKISTALCTGADPCRKNFEHYLPVHNLSGKNLHRCVQVHKPPEKNLHGIAPCKSNN